MIQYFEEWAWGQKEAQRFLSEDEARRRHSSFERYHAMLPQEDGYCVVEMLDFRRVLVFFVDAIGRYRGEYQFEREVEGQLFLIHTKNWLYEGDAVEPCDFFMTRTLEDGQTFGSHIKDGLEEEFEMIARPEDLAKHWEPYPAFGRYKSICRFNR